MTLKKYLTKTRVIVAAIILSISIPVFSSFDDENFEMVKNFDIYYTLFRDLNIFYVDEIKPGELIKKSIDEMLKSLDPYTVYYPESDMEDYKFMTTGQYGGIGALIRSKYGKVIITEPFEHFPAFKAGLKAGDEILSIDDKSTKGKNSSDISDLLKGTPSTELTLKIKRFGTEEPILFTLNREKIKINSVSYSGMLNDSVGYVKLSSFTRDAGSEVKKAILDLKNNHNAKSLIFDLRGNPGGLLIESIKIVNFFVPKDEKIVTTKGKVTQWNKEYYSRYEPLDTLIPLVILVNSGSASASEIVSGSIQDLDRGVILGGRTFGKGLVQTTRDISYNTKLKVTTAKYYIPSGRCIQALDYTHRKADGSVGTVPDSLISEFETKNGRKVFDGGGVTPDIKIEAPELSNIATFLYVKNMIFDYATKYASEHDSINKATDFKLSDDDYKDFVSFIENKKFEYKSISELRLKKLEEIAKDEKYYDIAKDEFDALRKKLEPNKSKDLELFKTDIKELLEDEIVSRYYFQTGRAIYSLANDPIIDKAEEILGDKKLYESVLNGTYEKNDSLRSK